MNRLFLVISAILLSAVFYAPLARSVETSPSGPSLKEKVLKGNNSFAVQLYRELGAKEGNLFFSPYSISSALAMTYVGACGYTAREMAGVLHFELGQTELHSAFKGLNKDLAATAHKAGQKLNIANALVLSGGDVSGEFKTILKDSYDAEVFGGGLETINGWVKQKTEGKMGMKDAFLSKADFSGMGSPKGRLFIGQIKHKAFVEVNEEGTEAAATTSVEMVTKSAMSNPPVFRADHPFLYLIRDNQSETILFMGRMARGDI